MSGRWTAQPQWVKITAGVVGLPLWVVGMAVYLGVVAVLVTTLRFCAREE